MKTFIVYIGANALIRSKTISLLANQREIKFVEALLKSENLSVEYSTYPTDKIKIEDLVDYIQPVIWFKHTGAPQKG